MTFRSKNLSKRLGDVDMYLSACISLSQFPAERALIDDVQYFGKSSDRQCGDAPEAVPSPVKIPCEHQSVRIPYPASNPGGATPQFGGFETTRTLQTSASAD